MSELDRLMLLLRENGQPFVSKQTLDYASSELAQLRATIAEQTRQLAAEREIIKASQYLTSSRPILNGAVEQWLSANAPTAQADQEQQP